MKSEMVRFFGETFSGEQVSGFYFEDEAGNSYIGNFANRSGCGICFQECITAEEFAKYQKYGSAIKVKRETVRMKGGSN